LCHRDHKSKIADRVLEGKTAIHLSVLDLMIYLLIAVFRRSAGPESRRTV